MKKYLTGSIFIILIIISFVFIFQVLSDSQKDFLSDNSNLQETRTTTIPTKTPTATKNDNLVIDDALKDIDSINLDSPDMGQTEFD